MLSFFRTNQLFFNILLVPYAIFLHGYAFTGRSLGGELSRSGILTDWVMERLPERGWSLVLLVILLVVVEGVAVNILMINHRLGREISLIPGLVFVLLASSFPDFLALSPLHFANFFFILALGELLATYKNSNCADQIFNIGFWIGIASMFYFPYLIFVFLGITGLNTLRAFKIREFLMVISGLLVPYFLLFIYYFWIGDTPTYFQFFQGQFAWLDLSLEMTWESYYKIALMGIALITIIFSYSRYMFKRNIQTYKKTNILYWCIFLGLLTIMITPGFHFDHLLILMVPMSMLISLNFEMLKPSPVETTHLIILFLVLFLQYNTFFFNV